MVNGDRFNNKKRGTVQKTSVGFHSRGVIPAISVGNTSALPAGSPSGGVRVGAAANAAETDVRQGEEEEDVFHLRISVALFCAENVGQGEQRRGSMVNEH